MPNSHRRFMIIRAIVFVVIVAIALFVFWQKKESSRVSSPATAISGESADRVYEGNNFSIRVPKTYAIDEQYRYQARGPENEIAGVSFTIPSSYTTGTNLAHDSRISVEQETTTGECSVNLFASRDVQQDIQSIDDDGVAYSYIETVEPAAGNSYEEHIYALVDSSPCTAVRYLIHSGNIYNYEPGAVKEFDKIKLLTEFDAIRRSLVIKKQ